MWGSLTAARLLTLLLFLLLVAIGSYWALQILAPRPAIAPSASIGDAAAAPNLAPAAVLFGSPSAVAAGSPSAQSNIQVSGIAEAGPNGVVILSIDGKPGAAYGIDESVTDGTTVKSVTLDKVVLNQRGRLIELKTPDRASMKVLSSGVGKPRSSSENSATPPVATRPVPPPPLPPPSTPSQQPQFQPPQPPQQPAGQQQQVQQQPAQQFQQPFQQQQQAQQPSPQGQLQPGPNLQYQPGAAPIQGAMPSASASSGQQQVPGQVPMQAQQPDPGQQQSQ